jgi:hypothetical protein
MSDTGHGNTVLRNGHVVQDRRLDRLRSEVTTHLERWPLTAETAPEEPVPVLAGVNWYSAADRPVLRRIAGKDRWVIGEGLAGPLRGGHAICLRSSNRADRPTWWLHYNQGSEGRCVEFAKLRMMSLLNRRMYDVTSAWHYWMDQFADEWAGGAYPGGHPHYEGTSVRAGLEGLRLYGAIRKRALPVLPVTPPQTHPAADPQEGIRAYRWCRTWDEVRYVTGTPAAWPGVPLLNSWGRGYPNETLLLDAFGERLLREDGEFGVPTDR